VHANPGIGYHVGSAKFMGTDRDGDMAEDGPRICVCMKVPLEILLRAIRDGARSVEDLGEATRAGTGCGTCRTDLEQLLREQREEGM
jgi:assimilatory nitrate reductase catalytic subunit